MIRNMKRRVIDGGREEPAMQSSLFSYCDLCRASWAHLFLLLLCCGFPDAPIYTLALPFYSSGHLMLVWHRFCVLRPILFTSPAPSTDSSRVRSLFLTVELFFLQFMFYFFLSLYLTDYSRNIKIKKRVFWYDNPIIPADRFYILPRPSGNK